MKKHAYSRELRLLTPEHFSQVFNSSPRKFACRLYTILVCKNQLGHPRIGFTISKKKAKLAVDRNRIKRVVRENFRLKNDKLPPIDMVFIARQGIAEQQNAEIVRELNITWQKIQKFSAKF